jgi:hypothetical protein
MASTSSGHDLGNFPHVFRHAADAQALPAAWASRMKHSSNDSRHCWTSPPPSNRAPALLALLA